MERTNYSLNFAIVAITFCVIVSAVVASLNVSLYLSVYPYLIIAVMGFAALFLSGNVQLKSSNASYFFALTPLFAILVHHTLVLNTHIFYALYALRFYFGLFFLIPFFYLFFDAVGKNHDLTHLFLSRLIEVLLTINFVMCMLEQLGHIKGFIMPWIPDHMLDKDLSLFSNTLGLPRSYGFTSNAAVLGGFSIFCALFYFALNNQRKRPFFIPVLSFAIITAVLSQSGTAYYCSILTYAILLIHFSLNKAWSRFYLLLSIGFSLVVLKTFFFANNVDRYSSEGLYNIIHYHGTYVLDFINAEINGRLSHLFFGSINYMELTLSHEHRDMIQGSSSLYDFALLALFMETGLVGLLTYISLFIFLIKKSFKSLLNLKSYACLILLFSSLHYGVIFWICSQVLVATILATHLIQNKYQASSLSTQ